jgi:hypothetical protein
MASSAEATPNGENADRKTHIEVCVRIRPLEVGNESSNGFLVDRVGSTTNNARSPPRSSRLRSPRSTPARGIKNFFKRTSSPDKDDTTIVAWEQLGETSVQQSDKTHRVQGRTHAYTVDQVYGPTSTTGAIFDKSVKDLVHAAVDGYHTSVLAYGQTSTGKTHTVSDKSGDLP